MAVTAYTLTEAREMRELTKEAIKELLSGQVQHYRIGTGEYTALDIDDLMRMLTYWSNMVDALSGNARTSKVTRVVPRDL